MSRHQTPAAELLRQARSLLREELVALLPPERRLDALMIANAMGMAERELTAGAAPEMDEIEALLGFLGEEAGPSQPADWHRKWAELRRRLGEAIRAGRHDGDPELHALLVRWVAWRLRETDPRVLGASGIDPIKSTPG